MPIDIEALKAKLDKMNNQGRGGQNTSSSILWKPDNGKHIVRIIPWPETMDVPDRPFIERWFYYGLGNKYTAPPQNKPDPVRELRNMLFADRTAENLAMAKRLKPKQRAFVPVLVRGVSDTEVKIWSIGQVPYKQLLGYVIDQDWGDITDINEGHDITVTIAESGKKFEDGTPIKDVIVAPQPKKQPIFAEKSKIDAILAAVPDLNALYPISTYEQLAEALDKFVSGAPTGQPVTRGFSQPAAHSAGPKTSSLDDEFDSLLKG
jgi:hypothetical protein